MQLPEAFPRELGLTDIRVQSRPTLRILYRDRDGNATAVRLRRYFGQLLALTRTHALLRQATRAREDHGRMVATLHDCAVVHELVVDVIAE